MNTKHYLLISGIVGGVIGSLLTALFTSPVTAQRDKFGDIECASLTVVDEKGRQNVVIASGERGGHVAAIGKDGIPKVELRASQQGGLVVVSGGRKNVAGFGGKGKVLLWVDVSGDGILGAWDYHGNPQWVSGGGFNHKR